MSIVDKYVEIAKIFRKKGLDTFKLGLDFGYQKAKENLDNSAKFWKMFILAKDINFSSPIERDGYLLHLRENQLEDLFIDLVEYLSAYLQNLDFEGTKIKN